MSNILDIVEEPGPDVDSRNAWKHIWLSPVSTFRYLLRYNVHGHVHLLFIIGGFSSALKRLSGWTFISIEGSWYQLLGALVLGTALGWAMYQLYSLCIQLVGKWLGANKPIKNIRLVLAWSLLPLIFSAVLTLPKLFIFGSGLFSSEKELVRTGMTGATMGIYVLEFALWLWTVTILVKGIALVLEVGYWKAIAILALAILLPLLLIALTGAVAFVVIDAISLPL